MCMRYYLYICGLLFCAGNSLFSQEKAGFYTAVSANGTFAKVVTSSEAIGAKRGFIPLPSIGVGALKPIAPAWYVDASFWCQTWLYRSTTRAFGTKNNSLSAGPLLNVKVGAILNRARRCKILLSAGASLGYSSDFKTEFTIRDTVAQKKIAIEDTRSSTI